VDCVGACVGMKGMRVQSIIRELRGEKIDIIEFSEDPVVFATHALSPAKISRVAITAAQDRHMEVIVDDTQLSLAIGKTGQNVRLAAKLLAWKIDIKSEEEKRQEVESQMAALVIPGAPVSVLMDYGLQEAIVDRLVAGGVGTIEALGNMTPEELEELPGIDADQVEQLRDAVIAYYGQFDQAGAVEEGTEETEQQPLSEFGETESGEPVEGSATGEAEDTVVPEEATLTEDSLVADEAELTDEADLADEVESVEEFGVADEAGAADEPAVADEPDVAKKSEEGTVA
jgi:transcription termination/antitermination protein NusA